MTFSYITDLDVCWHFTFFNMFWVTFEKKTLSSLKFNQLETCYVYLLALTYKFVLFVGIINTWIKTGGGFADLKTLF